MARKKKVTKETVRFGLGIVSRFREAHENKPSTTMEMTEWAIENKLWEPHLVEVKRQLADMLSQAMREEYLTDPQGRRVRAKHAAHNEQGVFWVDIRDKHPETRSCLEVAWQNRRQQIVLDCKQLKTDIDSYNQNWNAGEPVQYCFDFTDDLAELALMAASAKTNG